LKGNPKKTNKIKEHNIANQLTQQLRYYPFQIGII